MGLVPWLFCPVSGERIGNGGGVITPNLINKKHWKFTYYAFGKNHTIPLGTALGKILKKEAEERRKKYQEKYPDSVPLDALLEYAQNNEIEFAITDEDWGKFIEEMKEMKEKKKKEMEKKENERRVSTRKRKV